MSALITDEYRRLNAELHQRKPNWGSQGGYHATWVRRLMAEYGARSVLDYGCGKGGLGKALGIPVAEYDPAIPGKDQEPTPADLVVCTDVLEHIEPACLEAVLEDLRRVTLKVGYLVVATDAAVHALPDGRNAHAIQQGPDWWWNQVSQHFAVKERRVGGNSVRFVVAP